MHTSSRHLVVSISGHGFGHVAQTAPVLNELHRLCPSLQLTVRSSAPRSHLRSRIHAPFNSLASNGDIGMAMSSALSVDVETSRVAYRHFHADWAQQIETEARTLRELKADMVFSDVGYLPLAGAQRAEIPNVAMCSLNWSDIYRHYCTQTADQLISQQIQSCYAQADAFLRTTPGMPMSDLKNLVPVAPIAAIGINCREELHHQLKLSRDEKLILVSMGGISNRLNIEEWPSVEGVRYLVQKNWQIAHPNAIEFDDLPFSFSDLLASCDALLCKPGYGSFVEAACCGIPVLYLGRPDWPESPALISWLQQHGLCREVTLQELAHPNLGDILQTLWRSEQPVRVQAEGASQVANWILDRLA